MGRAAGKRVRRGGPGCAPRAGSTSGGHMGNFRPPYWSQPGAVGGLEAGTVSCPSVSQNLSHWGIWVAVWGRHGGHVPALEWDGLSTAEAPSQRGQRPAYGSNYNHRGDPANCPALLLCQGAEFPSSFAPPGPCFQLQSGEGKEGPGVSSPGLAGCGSGRSPK